ncbi:hypothetical protein [Microbacterium sp. CFBP9034]|uniref:hypothetical protein n=1 Tax=Microbacterium sp. CFBP9034 TaxID=3096540 RepID=UPI002A6B0418|nr:hypothetical protein [Microbacterium sp. CFBP9034]MDY0911062.1 hypothetical protein [Microbacterium sp. CFBP9034]
MKRAAVVGVAAGVTAIVIAAGATGWLLTRPSGPDAAARGFLEALAADDAEAAVALLADEPESRTDLVAAYDGATSMVVDPRVIGTESESGGRSRAEVSFTLDGDVVTTSFGLVETRDGWRIAADGLGAVTPTVTIGDAVATGSALLPAGTESDLLPGAYALAAAPVRFLDGETTATVLPGGSEQPEVEASVDPAATEAAQDQFDAYLEECAAPATAVPDNCGLRVPWAVDLTSLDRIAFRIDERPVLALSEDGASFDATGGVIVATATGTARGGGTASFTYRADDWALRGSVRFTGDDLVLVVR